MTNLLTATARETRSIPAITRSDQYIHMLTQFKHIRGRSGDALIQDRFAIEMAVLFPLHEFDGRIGTPLAPMPQPDGQGGVCPEPVIPVEWLS